MLEPAVTRREASALALAATSPPTRAGLEGDARITCFIHYRIDPFQREAFRRYAERWARIIPRLGGHLVGYFLPDEGTNDVAYGLIAFSSLAAYERYRAKLKADPEAAANLDFAHADRFILREERAFLETVASTFDQPPVG